MPYLYSKLSVPFDPLHTKGKKSVKTRGETSRNELL